MPDFSHFAAAQPSETLAEYAFSQLEGCPRVWVAFAGETNKAYLNDTLKRMRGKSNAMLAARLMSPDQLREVREEDRQIYSRHVVKRWDVRDASGEAVELNPQNCLEFLQALPNWVFDELRAFAGNPVNFLPAGVAGAEETGKD